MSDFQKIVATFRKLGKEQSAALATVVSVEGSSYRRPGARMLITESGETTGVLSGGCLERDVCDRARKVMRTGESAVVRYDTTNKDDLVWGLGLGCNGIVHVLIEPITNKHVAGVMQLLAECAEADAPGAAATVFHVEGEVETTIGARALLFPDGTVDGEFTTQSIFDDLRDAQTASVKRYEVSGGYVDVFLEVVQPRVRFVLFGAGPDVLPIVNLAKTLNWHTTVVDPSARVSSRERFKNADAVLLCRPEEVMKQVTLSERTIVVVMTHNYLHDVELLRHFLQLPLRYLGCLGPKRRTERLLTEVSAGDARLAVSYLRRVHAPVGLDIGAETPEEIALSIVSEIKAVLAERTGAQLRERAGSIHGWSSAVATQNGAGVFEARMGIGAIVLAAGGSSRMRTPKQLLSFRGETLIRHAAKAALASVCDRVVVVVGSHASQMRSELDDLPVFVVENENWQSGMSSSIRTGLEDLLSRDADGVVIMLCDQPFATARVLNELVSTHRKTRQAIVASTYGTTRGVPAFFSRELFTALASLKADEGARRIIAAHPENVATIAFPQGIIDVDTPQDLTRLTQSIS